MFVVSAPEYIWAPERYLHLSAQIPQIPSWVTVQTEDAGVPCLPSSLQHSKMSQPEAGFRFLSFAYISASVPPATPLLKCRNSILTLNIQKVQQWISCLIPGFWVIEWEKNDVMLFSMFCVLAYINSLDMYDSYISNNVLNLGYSN